MSETEKIYMRLLNLGIILILGGASLIIFFREGQYTAFVFDCILQLYLIYYYVIK